MRFQSGDWTHEKFMDVFFEVHKARYQDGKQVKLKGTWWNLGWTENPFPLHFNDTITVKAKDFAKWSPLKSRLRKVE